MTDWMLFWTAFFAIFTAIMAVAISITAVFAIVQLIHAKKARYSSLLMQLHQIWQSNEYVEARAIINKYYTGANPEKAAMAITKSLIRFSKANTKQFFIMIRPAEYFENLGFLVCNGHLDKKQATQLFGDVVASYWELYRGYAVYLRESDPPSPRVWINFEYLALRCPKDVLKRNKCLNQALIQ